MVEWEVFTGCTPLLEPRSRAPHSPLTLLLLVFLRFFSWRPFLFSFGLLHSRSLLNNLIYDLQAVEIAQLYFVSAQISNLPLLQGPPILRLNQVLEPQPGAERLLELREQISLHKDVVQVPHYLRATFNYRAADRHV